MRTDRTKNDLSWQLFEERRQANELRRENAKLNRRLDAMKRKRPHKAGVTLRLFLDGLLFGGREE